MARLSVRGIDEDVLVRFKSHVKRTYGKMHGALGQEVSKALELYQQKIGSALQINNQTKNSESVRLHQLETLVEELQGAVSELTELLDDLSFSRESYDQT